MMGDLIQLPISDTTRKLRAIKQGLAEGKTARQIVDEADAKKADVLRMALGKSIEVTASHLGWAATREILRQYLQKHGEKL